MPISVGPRGHYLGADGKQRKLPKIYQAQREGTARVQRKKVYCESTDDSCKRVCILCLYML